MDNLSQLLLEAKQSINAAKDLVSLDNVRVAYLGKKGHLTEKLKSLKDYPPDERKELGKIINDAKEMLTSAFQEARQRLEDASIRQQLAEESIDITLPGRGDCCGTLHPITITMQRICDLFAQLGFCVKEGPEVETEYYNFEALNIPAHHPARAMHDTFYFPNGTLLRTHTSSVQIRVMENSPPPLRIIAPGRVYRYESDVTHTPMFHQIEGLWIDKQVSFADLKGLLAEFVKAFFEADVATRFRASYFPFTEPSAEVDVTCVKCQGKGCRICKNTGWLEVLGCGMVHPKVLEYGGINPEEFAGFAFGMGVERLAMLRYEVDDLRIFFENDLKVLKQFNGV